MKDNNCSIFINDREVIYDTTSGDIFPAMDADQFASKIAKALTEKRRSSDAALHLVKNGEWEVIIMLAAIQIHDMAKESLAISKIMNG